MTSRLIQETEDNRYEIRFCGGGYFCLLWVQIGQNIFIGIESSWYENLRKEISKYLVGESELTIKDLHQMAYEIGGYGKNK